MKSNATGTNTIVPNSKTLPWEGDSKAMSYLEAASTRPNQSMNVVMTDAIRAPQDSGSSAGSTSHKNTSS